MDINNDINPTNKANINDSERTKLLKKQSDVQERESVGEEETRKSLQAQDAYGKGLINAQKSCRNQVNQSTKTENKKNISREVIDSPEKIETKIKPNRSFGNKVNTFLLKQKLRLWILDGVGIPRNRQFKKLNKLFEYPDLLEKYPEQFNSNFIKNDILLLDYNTSIEEETEAIGISLDTIRNNSDLIEKYPVLQKLVPKMIKFSSKVSAESLSQALELVKERQNILDKSSQTDNILSSIAYANLSKDSIPVIDRLFEHSELLEKYPSMSVNLTSVICASRNPELKLEIIDKLINNPEYAEKYPNISKDIVCLISDVGYGSDEYIREILENPEIAEKYPLLIDLTGISNQNQIKYATHLYQNFDKMELTGTSMSFLVNNYGTIEPKQLKQLQNKIGRANVEKLSYEDLAVSVNFIDLANINNINEIPQNAKKDVLRELVAYNESLFNLSDTVKENFPLLPINQEEYCELLPAIVRSLGIETNTLDTEKIEQFNKSMTGLSNVLSEISDDEFNEITVSQEITRNDFIDTVKEKVKDLPKQERQKVFDYYGFELHHNKKNPTGYTLTGYPVNLNNGKKLAQIDDPKTKEVIENLRSDVIKYSTDNKVIINNPQVEKFMNDIVGALPELRTMIGRVQYGNDTNHGHGFDVMKHSLKVMQKISQDSKFKSLNESDKKLMLLAGLMHDITKSEGYVDKTHAKESAFDAHYICKKFNLSKAEENKLYALIKNHEWLEYANTSKSEEELTKRLQSIAFDLQQYNLVDMAEIFTTADLKGVKKDDSFFNRTDGEARLRFDGTQHSFGDSAAEYLERIRGYVKELKTTQPLLPITKMPSASTIEKYITHVNDDGSTNIKGVYKDKDGLVVVKFNEVENWEELGLPKGTSSKGYKTKAVTSVRGKVIRQKNAETGNIKFFVHGLDYPNQLAKFDAFATPDSDVLLSVSYTERPETKYRFFRAQGVMLDVPADYVYGGGNTDSGSGCGKNIDKFKSEYIFGGDRESDRRYISDLIKNATGMNDEEYVKFVEENKDKPMLEIEPKEIREKIIEKFGTINSNKRNGNREYNEMYISNPSKVMGVFAYNMNKGETIEQPLKFLEEDETKERTQFLKKYALEHDIPFYVFGD